jgi:hypothetical protein
LVRSTRFTLLVCVLTLLANTIEAVIVSIRAQFLEGGARLDMSNKRDYTESEAKEAFDRMVSTQILIWYVLEG